MGCVNPIKAGWTGLAGVGKFIGALLGLAIGFSGIFAVFQFISAGYMYLSSQGDPKKAEMAWWRIQFAIMGLVVIGASFLITEAIEKITGINPLKIIITGP